jgi:exonuclease VII small subunit
MSLADSYAVRDQLYTRHGGMYYGIKQLLDYETGYSQKIHRFADFNAGRFASRNAAFQKIISELNNQALALDGDLLLYDKGEASSRVSASEAAIRQLEKKFALSLSKAEIREDLLRSRNFDFNATKTFSRVRNLYQQQTGKQPPFAVLPEIELASPKIQRRMTTAIFATTVNRRYQACMANR